MYELIIFLWIVGWFFTCGKVQYSLEKAEERGTEIPPMWKSWVVMFFMWPHYQGYGE